MVSSRKRFGPTLKLEKSAQAQGTIDKLIASSRKLYKVTDDGRLTGGAEFFSENLALFALCFKYSGDVESGLFRGAVVYAIRRTIEGDGASAEMFLGFCNKYLTESQSKPVKRYALWSNINSESSLQDAVRFKIDSVDIYIGGKRPKIFSDFKFENFYGVALHREPSPGRSFIWAYCTAHDEMTAGSKIDRSINLLSALISFQIFFKARVNIFASKVLPMSPLLHGPTYYLYNRDEKSWSQTVWLAENFIPSFWQRKSISHKDIARVAPAVRSHFKRIQASKLSERLRNTLVHLGSCWTASQPKERATQLWMAYECLFSDRSKSTDQQSIIRRAVHGLEGEERWKMQQRLRFLSELRNDAVHAYAKFVDIDHSLRIVQICNLFLVNSYIELLRANDKIIENDADFISQQELPSSVDILRKKRDLIDYEIERLQRH